MDWKASTTTTNHLRWGRRSLFARTRLPVFANCEAICSRFTPKMNSYRLPVSGKVVCCSCPVLHEMARDRSPVFVQMVFLTSCANLKSSRMAGHRGVWGRRFGVFLDYGWSSFRGQGSGVRDQRTEIRKTLVGVRGLPDPKIWSRATQLCGSVKGGALAELRHPARRKGWETTNPSRRNQGE